MKKRKNFKINNLLWPGVVLAGLVLAAIWTNAGFLHDAPAQYNAPGFVQGPLLEAPAVVPRAEAAASPTTALMVQEGISRVVAMVRPAVVGVSRLANPMTGSPKTMWVPVHINWFPGSRGWNSYSNAMKDTGARDQKSRKWSIK